MIWLTKSNNAHYIRYDTLQTVLHNEYCNEGFIMLLHSQHWERIWTGQALFWLPNDTLSGYPEPWSWKMSRKDRKELIIFSGRNKKSPRHGGEMSPRISWTLFVFFQLWKIESKNLLNSVFSDHFPPMSGTLFFFQISKTVSALDTPSCNFSEPGFWIPTKGG